MIRSGLAGWNVITSPPNVSAIGIDAIASC
jgi:hypothetical protein